MKAIAVIVTFLRLALNSVPKHCHEKFIWNIKQEICPSET